MIRINLLEHMPAPNQRLQTILNPSRAGGFISRRETLLGSLFLLLALAILGTQFWLRQKVDEPPMEEVDESPAYGNPRYKMGSEAANPFAVKPKEPAETERERMPASGRPATAGAAEKASVATEPAVAKAAAPPASESIPQASGRPAAEGAASGSVTSVRVTPLEDGVDIFLPIKGELRVRSFRVDDPKRVVFDIPGAKLEAPREQTDQGVESALVSRVRAAQNSIDPPLVRVVLEVPEYPSIQHSVSDAGVAIRVRQP